MLKTDKAAILESLREFDTALLANTIGYIDPTPAHEYYMASYIQSVTPSLGPTVGVAVTCEVDSSTPEGEGNSDLYYEQIEQIEKMDEPAIWVVKAMGSRPDFECIMGDGMGKTLFSAGCVGIVTDGGVRDVSALLTIPFAAYSKGKTIHHCAFRAVSINKPITIGGLNIKTGDVLHANNEGVIRIPDACLGVLAAQARQMRLFEFEAHEILRSRHIPQPEKKALVLQKLHQYGFANLIQ